MPHTGRLQQAGRVSTPVQRAGSGSSESRTYAALSAEDAATPLSAEDAAVRRASTVSGEAVDGPTDVDMAEAERWCGVRSFHPNQNIGVTMWQCLVNVTIILVLCLVPVRLAFGGASWEAHADGKHATMAELVSGAVSWPEVLLDVIWSLDIIAHCRIGYRDDTTGWVVYDNEKILRNYASSWMVFDVVAVAPSLWVLVAAATGSGTGVLVQQGVFRLAKVPCLMDGTYSQLTTKIAKESTDILRTHAPGWTGVPQVARKTLNVLLTTGCLTHVLGCLWYSVGSNNDTLSGGQHVQGWVSQEGWKDEVDVGTRWLRSFYWGFTTITTIGYGDIVASTNNEMLFTLATQVVGVICNAVLIATVCKIFDQSSKVQDEHDNYRSDMTQWMQKKNVSHNLQVRSLQFMDHLYEVEDNFDVPKLLEKLPPALEFELLEHVSIQHLRSADLCEGFPDDVLVDLARGLVPYPVTAGEVIFKRGDKARETYLVVSGHEGTEAQINLDNPAPEGGWKGVATDTQARHIVLGEGEFFGENALDFKDNVDVFRNQTATALTSAELLLLPANAVEEVADGYPKLRTAVMTFCALREEQLEEGTVLGMHAYNMQRKRNVAKKKMQAAMRLHMGLGNSRRRTADVVSELKAQQPELELEPEPETETETEPDIDVQERLTSQDTRMEKLEQQQDLILQKLDQLLMSSQGPMVVQHGMVRTGSASASV